MKITCEYCGAQFDTAVAKKCPNCGASFNDNDELAAKISHENKKAQPELEKEAIELERRKIENAQKSSIIRLEQQEARIGKIVKIGCAAPVICAAIIWVIFMAVGFLSLSTGSNSSDNHHSTTVTQPAETPVTVGLNETAQTLKYTVVCDKFEVIERGVFTPTEGYQYMSFHLVVENKSEERINIESAVDCVADGIACTARFDSERKHLPKYLNKGTKTDGNICFEVPIGAKSFDIKYGDYVTIHIKNVP